MSLQALRNAFKSFLVACERTANSWPGRQRPSESKRVEMRWIAVDFRCHDLRHTYATMLYDAGVDVKTAQRWLGHASPELTMRIYTHLSEQREQKSVDAAHHYFHSLYGSGSKSGSKPDSADRKT